MKISALYGEGFVSVWWYTPDGEFWDFSKPVGEGVIMLDNIQYSEFDTHLSLWREAVEKYCEDESAQSDIINKGYKSYERGRVAYDTRTMCYTIYCSEKLYDDLEFRKHCIYHFELSGSRYEFVPCNYYYV